MTSVSLNGNKEGASSITLNLAIPARNFGLLMIYAKKASDSREDQTAEFLTAAAEGKYIAEFNSGNNYSQSVEWRDDGMRVLRIEPDATMLTLTVEANTKATIVFSNLDIVPEDDSWNKKLGIESDGWGELLAKLKNYDGFWYNCILDSGEAIGFNEDDESDDMKNVSS